VAIEPPKNTRIKNVSFDTQFLMNKDKGVKLEMNYRILTGTGSLAEKQEVFAESSEEKNKKLSLNLSVDENGKKNLAAAECSAARLVGADLSMINYRSSFKEKVDLTQDKNKEAILT